MRLPINPVTVDDKVCTEAEVSVAVSSSTAIRLVPVDGDGVQHPDGAFGIVGDASTPDIEAFMAGVAAAVATLAAGRGI